MNPMAEYIEREALLEDIENTLVFSGRPDRQNPKQMGARLVVQRIRCVPAADVAPVVHGRWIKPTKIGNRAFDIPHCSACDGVPCGVDENTKYRPNCGATMDLEVDDD